MHARMSELTGLLVVVRRGGDERGGQQGQRARGATWMTYAMAMLGLSSSLQLAASESLCINVCDCM
jgi:hypothetical protein